MTIEYYMSEICVRFPCYSHGDSQPPHFASVLIGANVIYCVSKITTTNKFKTIVIIVNDYRQLSFNKRC